jgi:putative tryptophan/tyrosine transport system substrate-binding protein
MTVTIGRRELLAALGGAAAAWPLAARAQQPAMPVVGFLSSATPEAYQPFVSAYHAGLKETGYVEGHNVAIEYRWAQGEYARLPNMADDLIRARVTVIAAAGTPAALAAKAATTSIPIAFVVVDDPARLGLVDSLSRPGGNATGVNFFVAELGSKQLGLLHELVPAAVRVGLLIDPSAPTTEPVTRDVMAAAAAVHLQIEVVEASNSREIEAAFATIVRNKADALLVGPDALLLTRRLQIATLATHHTIPTLYNVREYVEAGGLMSYGTNQTEAYRQFGVYTGKILKGIKPADLPVVQSTKFELVINLPTAHAIGLEIPPALLARADEVIE